MHIFLFYQTSERREADGQRTREDNNKGKKTEHEEGPKGRTGSDLDHEEEGIEVRSCKKGKLGKNKVDESVLGDHDVPPAPEAGF